MELAQTREPNAAVRYAESTANNDDSFGVATQRDRLQQNTEQLTAALEQLANQINPALTPISPMAEGNLKEAVAPAESPLARDLRARNSELETLIAQVESLRQRVEL